MQTYITLTSDNTQKYPLHSHTYWEVLCYVHGEGSLRTPERDYAFAPGTVMIIPPGILHGSESKSTFKNICIGGDFSHFFTFEDICVIPKCTQEAGTLAEMIYNNCGYSDSFLSSLCQTYCYCLLKNINHGSKLSTVLDEIVKNITENALHTDFDISAILNHQYYTKDYIRTEFKTATGKTPTEFLTDFRMQHAVYLLNIYKNSITIGELSEKCGYNDSVYFSRLFKRYTGKSPKQYRDTL